MPGDERPSQVSLLTGVERALAEGDLEILGWMPNASNHTYLASCRVGGEEVLAVYKPERGEAPLWDFPEGTLARREVAAFRLSRTLGWPNVPPTVLREGPEGMGAVQLFVRFDPEHHFFTLEEARADEFRKVALFDAVINNADRKAGHCLLGEDGLVWLIDHGVCFHEESKLRTVIWGFAGEPIQAALRADLDRLARSLENGPLRSSLLELLSPAEVEATGRRLARLLASGEFPHPDPDRRPYPWPPL